MDISFYENRCLRGPETRGNILELYTLFVDQGSKRSCHLGDRPEGDYRGGHLGLLVTMVHKGILNISLVEANYKVWYPVRLAKTPHPFVSGGQDGNMFHI